MEFIIAKEVTKNTSFNASETTNVLNSDL